MWSKYFFSKTDNAPLVVFRILFGLIMAFSMGRYYWNDWVSKFYLDSKFHFKYSGFNWVPELSDMGIQFIFALAFISTIGILFGFLYRISTILFFISYTYIELIDSTFYLNHYYLITLLSGILIFLPANKRFSIDAYLYPKIKNTTCESWNINLLKYQIGLVYFFAGIAKLNPDWLFEALPVKIWLMPHFDTPIIGSTLQWPYTAYVFVWIGCIYDLSIAFFLLNKNTRKYAYLLVIVFHLATAYLFSIGLFPFIMIFITWIFFDADFHTNILRFIGEKKTNSSHAIKKSKKWILIPLIAYCTFQFLFPLRHWLYDGNVLWTEEGYKFSWRVKLISKIGNSTFTVVDKETGRSIEIKNRDYLSPIQEKKMTVKPEMIVQYAHYLAEQYEDTVLHIHDQSIHIKNPKIKAEIYISFNGRASELFIDPKVDLSQINHSDFQNIILNRKYPFDQ